MQKILVTGATGQIGTELTRELRQRFGRENVLASSHHEPAADVLTDWAPYRRLDVTDNRAVAACLRDDRIDRVYHLAAIMSATGEQDPRQAWQVNIEGLRNVLEAAREARVRRMFWPSSIAAFGLDSPRDQTPQDTVMHPTTMYGITKVAGELLCDYYFQRYRLDVRGVRYPGVVSSEALPGGGTTDYAVEMFYAALRSGRYTCFVREDTVLPMIYMPDCIQAAVDLMDADLSNLRHHNAFNVTAMSFSAGELAAEIRRHLPHFECQFQPDERQKIADSWPRSLDDSAARAEWGWLPRYNLASMTAHMLDRLRARGIG